MSRADHLQAALCLARQLADGVNSQLVKVWAYHMKQALVARSGDTA